MFQVYNVQIQYFYRLQVFTPFEVIIKICYAPLLQVQGFLGGSVGEEFTCNVGDKGDVGSIPGLGRSPGEGHGNSLQYSCLENSMDRGAWWATVYRVTKSQTWLKQLSTCAHNVSYLFYPQQFVPLNPSLSTLIATICSLYLCICFCSIYSFVFMFQIPHICEVYLLFLSLTFHCGDQQRSQRVGWPSMGTVEDIG